MKLRILRGVATAVVCWLVLLTVVPPALPQTPTPPPVSPETPVPGPQVPLSPAYTVGPGDVLAITVLGEPQASGVVTVSPDGTITLPLTGAVHVADLTVDQIVQRLTEVLKKYDREPHVVVAIQQAGQHRLVYLLGQATHPGAYQMQKGWTLAELFAVAGGPAPRAALNQAVIMRNNKTIPVDLQELLVQGKPSANVPLQAGDVVMVPETKDEVVVMGQVLKAGSYMFKPGARVVDVLSEAGGPNDQAAINNIGVLRQGAQKQATVLHANLDTFYKDGDMSQNVALLPGDIVYVPKRGLSWQDVFNSIPGLGVLFTIFK